MKTLLWVLVVAGGLNTLCALIAGLTGTVQPIPGWARAVDAVYAAVLGAWALWLLARGVA